MLLYCCSRTLKVLNVVLNACSVVLLLLQHCIKICLKTTSGTGDLGRAETTWAELVIKTGLCLTILTFVDALSFVTSFIDRRHPDSFPGIHAGRG
jgi:hypothetical protein